MRHTVRTADGGRAAIEPYHRGMAVRLMCTECMGWETDPKECTCTMCPLYPFRRRTRRAMKGDKE